jgi:hypothetical protein
MGGPEANIVILDVSCVRVMNQQCPEAAIDATQPGEANKPISEVYESRKCG